MLFDKGRRNNYFYAILLFFLCVILYSATNYGGVRSPDGEVVFRAGEAFSQAKLAVESQLPWEGFGLPRGLDGRRYSLFGPTESILLVPFIKIAKMINKTEWYHHEAINIPLSFYIDDGLFKFITNQKPDVLKKQAHALRTICSWFNVIVCALVVMVFFLITEQMTSSLESAFIVSIILAFGTLLWPYSGTFFSEPLSILFILISFYYLVQNDKSVIVSASPPAYKNLVYSGIFIGLSFTTHVSAILFFPFFLLYALYPYYEGVHKLQRFCYPVICFCIGFGVFIILQMYYNYIRFGDIFEVGRRAEIVYSHFIYPWRSLYGLLFSAGKGLLFYNPIILLGILCWYSFYKKHKFLAIIFIFVIFFRVLFIASRSNWHGGFCLGPRHLLMIIPFFLLPIGYWVKEKIQSSDYGIGLPAAIGFVFACMIQQIYFCIGEIFTFLHMIKLVFWNHGFDVFKNDWIYFTWKYSALYKLLEINKRGPFLLQHFSMNHYIFFFCCSLLFVSLMISIGYCLLKRRQKI
ncbi:MAG: phospholipid carrier-dependent glycosyltransferase [Pseudomonadota bacterium]